MDKKKPTPTLPVRNDAHIPLPGNCSVQPCPGECRSRGIVFVMKDGPGHVRERCPTCDGWGFVRVPIDELVVVERAELPKNETAAS